MKNIYFLLSASLLIASCGPVTVVHQSDGYQPAPAPVEDVSYQSFYDQLSPYGNWINYPGYGYVWSPNAGPDFQPYASNGNWIYTDAGWTWASNYNWGWAPFHYGRWFYENGYGWMWVPGSEWAPAWVSWRGGGDYYGWAPLGPTVSVDIALSNYNPPSNYWNFVPRQYMGNPNWHNYYVGGNRNVTIINNTTIINNYSGMNRAQYAYAPGPDPNEVRRYSGNNFTPVQLRQSSTPGARISGSQYQIYQPRVSATPASHGDAPGRPSTPAPARYESFNNVRPSTQYPANQPANNQRPATQTPTYTPPANNQRPATQTPTYTPPANNQRPGAQTPTYTPQASNQRPVMETPTYTPPINNQPVNHPPANNSRPVTPNPAYNQPQNNPPVNNPAANNTKPSNPNLNDRRLNQYNQTPGNAHPVPNNQATQHPPVNQAQTTGKPATNHNPNNGHPVPKPTTTQNKTETKPVAPPKTREADGN